VLARWIGCANESGSRIFAIDIPSGLNAETGVAYAPSIRADATATFIALKPGLLTADGPDHCGAISVHRLDLDFDARSSGAGRRLAWDALAAALPSPLLRARHNVHKGTAILAGRAAAHLGAGKVWVGLATSERPGVDWMQPELMLRQANDVLASKPDALLVGPGLGTDAEARELLVQALALDCPIAVDADALNLVAGDAALGVALASRKAPSAMTPHPAEAARLAHTNASTVQSDRLQAAQDLSARFKASVVLKGAGSIVAHGDGTWAINVSGNAALASGGTGDVLAGMLAAFIVQGVPVNQALELAVCLHGAAADALVVDGVGPVGVTASELLPVSRRLLNAAAGGAAR